MNKKNFYGLIAVLLSICLFSPSCLRWSAKTDIRVESYKDTVSLNQKTSQAQDAAFQVEQKEVTRYRLAIMQKTYLDLGRTIWDSLEMVRDICYSIALYLIMRSVTQ